MVEIDRKRRRNPDVVAPLQLSAHEIRWRHAHHIERHAVDLDRPAGLMRVAAKIRPPGVVAQHANPMGALHPVVFVVEQSPQGRARAEECEIPAVHQREIDLSRFPVQVQHALALRERGRALEDRGLPAEFPIRRIGVAGYIEMLSFCLHLHDAVRVGHGEFLQ